MANTRDQVMLHRKLRIYPNRKLIKFQSPSNYFSHIYSMINHDLATLVIINQEMLQTLFPFPIPNFIIRCQVLVSKARERKHSGREKKKREQKMYMHDPKGPVFKSLATRLRTNPRCGGTRIFEKKSKRLVNTRQRSGCGLKRHASRIAVLRQPCVVSSFRSELLSRSDCAVVSFSRVWPGTHQPACSTTGSREANSTGKAHSKVGSNARCGGIDW